MRLSVFTLVHQLELEAIAVGLDLTDRLGAPELRSEQLPWTKGASNQVLILEVFEDWHGSSKTS